MPTDRRTPRTRHQAAAFFSASGSSPVRLQSRSPTRTASAPAATAARRASAEDTQVSSSIPPPPFPDLIRF